MGTFLGGVFGSIFNKQVDTSGIQDVIDRDEKAAEDARRNTVIFSIMITILLVAIVSIIIFTNKK